MINRRQRNLVRVVEVPVFLRRDERQMRLRETNREEERFALRLQLVQPLHGLGGGRTVGQLVVGLRADFKRRALLRALAILALWPGLSLGELGHIDVVLGLDLLRPVHEVGVHGVAAGIPVRLAPRAAVLQALVVNLVQRRRVIAVRLEVLRQRGAVRLRDAEVRRQIPHARGVGAKARHDRRARRAAHGLRDVGAVEDRAARGDPVNVRRFRDLVPITAQVRPQVIHGDEEDVGFAGGVERGKRQQRGGDDEFQNVFHECVWVFESCLRRTTGAVISAACRWRCIPRASRSRPCWCPSSRSVPRRRRHRTGWRCNTRA